MVLDSKEQKVLTEKWDLHAKVANSRCHVLGTK